MTSQAVWMVGESVCAPEKCGVMVLAVEDSLRPSDGFARLNMPFAQTVVHDRKEPMLITMTTRKSPSEAATALQAAVQAHHFGVMHIHDLKDTMLKKGVIFGHECMIFEVCQPQQAKKVLDQDMSVSTALPCRISVYEAGGKTMLSTLKPTVLLAMFNAPQLADVAKEVEDTIVAIMTKAASD